MKKTITVTAYTEGKAEAIVRAIDKTYRHFYNVHGTKRIGSYRNTIIIEIDDMAWSYFRRAVLWHCASHIDPNLCWNDTPECCRLWCEE